MARDSQRTKVYEAEFYFRRDCAGKSLRGHKSPGLFPELRFNSVEDVQRYVDKTLSIPYSRRYARRPCKVIPRRGERYAHYQDDDTHGEIHLPPNPRGWAMREVVVLHELAHHLTRSEKYAAHGPEFCGRFLLLIELTMGLDARNRLMYYYIQQGVKIKIPHSKT